MAAVATILGEIASLGRWDWAVEWVGSAKPKRLHKLIIFLPC
jgi:hypothetical protein